MTEQMVTISLDEYNKLRDCASLNRLMLDKMLQYETQILDLRRKLDDVEYKVGKIAR